jgi:hypothetical protein
MPLASLAPAAEIRLQLSHSSTSVSDVPKDDESYVNVSSEKDNEQQEFITYIVRGGDERGRGRGRGRGWNPRTMEVGEEVLSDDEVVNQRVIRRGRHGRGSKWGWSAKT